MDQIKVGSHSLPFRVSILFILVVTILAAQPAPERQATFDDLLKSGFELHRQQQYARSIPLLQKAHALRPDDARVNLLLGIDLLRSERPREAVAYLSAARKADPAESASAGYLAEAYAALNRFDRTAELLGEASVSTHSLEAELALIRFYIRRFGDIEQELRSTTSGLAYAYRLQAMALHASRNPKELEMLRSARQLMPHMPGIDSAIGRAELTQANYEAARTDFERARELNPNDLDMLTGQAILAMRAGDPPQAEGLLGIVAAHSPHRLEIALHDWPPGTARPPQITKRSGALEQTGSPVSSADLFQQQRWEELVKRFESRTRDGQQNLWLATALAYLDRYGDAIPPLERARQQSSLKVQADYWLSLCYANRAEQIANGFRAGQNDELLSSIVQAEVLLRLARDGAGARAQFEKALALTPNDPALWAGVAEAQLMAGDTNAARDAAHRALNIDPQRAPALRVFAEAAIQERDYSTAIPAARKLLEVRPDDPAAGVLLGTAYAKTGSHQLAVRYLEDALKRGYPDEKGALHYLLGTSLRQLGRSRDADQALRQAAEISNAYAQSSHAGGKDPQ